ncbi:hypothetical protein B0H13DRAFT_1890612 [Mycena leptocephala]|nr:hypothetical protein B0H13DRAFT_1890612 [Mycena leptocephala]
MCTLSLSFFSRVTGRGWLFLMDHVAAALPQPSDHKLEAWFIKEVFSSTQAKKIDHPDLLISQAKSHFSHLNDPVLESRFYRALGLYYDLHYNYTEAMQYLEKTLSLAKSSEATLDQAEILNYCANIKFRIGEYTTGQTLAIKAQRLARLCAGLYQEATALRTDARCCQALGNFRHSVFMLHRARDLLRLCGMSGGSLDNIILNNEAEAHLLKSEYAEARQIHTQIAQSTSPDQAAATHAFAFLNIVEIDMLIDGNEHDVTHNLHHAKTLFSNGDNPDGIIFCEMVMAKLRLREGDTLTARAIFSKYLQWPWTRVPEITFFCLDYMADIDRWGRTNCHQTYKWAVIFLAHANRFHARLELCKALQFLAKLCLTNGDELTAESLFTVALDGFTYMDVHHSRAACMLHLGDIARQWGQLIRASTLWNDARPLFERSLQAKYVSEIDARLTELEGHYEPSLENIAQLTVSIVPLQELSVLPESMVDEGKEDEVQAA